MLYRSFGKTEASMSALGFGCMRLPLYDDNPAHIDEEKAIAMIHHAVDNGVNYFDTAYPYHGSGMAEGGQSEPFLAKALESVDRDRVNIASKLPSWLIQTRDDMDRYLDEQLSRLNTDYIDFYLLHSLNSTFWPNLVKLDYGDFLDKALADGRIRHAGFSYHDEAPLFKEIVDAYDWSFCQIQYNYLDEENQAGTTGLEYAAAKGLGIVIMEPLRGGSLANTVPDDVMDVFSADRHDRTPAEWALRWVWNRPEVSVVLSGMTTMDQLKENLRIADEAEANAMDSDELDVIGRVRDLYEARQKINCTNCKYCMPCPAGVNIPKNFEFFNEFHRFDSDLNRGTYKFRYTQMFVEEEKAHHCVECGKCEEHCPQHISIRKELKRVTETFAQ